MIHGCQSLESYGAQCIVLSICLTFHVLQILDDRSFFPLSLSLQNILQTVSFCPCIHTLLILYILYTRETYLFLHTAFFIQLTTSSHTSYKHKVQTDASLLL